MERSRIWPGSLRVCVTVCVCVCSHLMYFLPRSRVLRRSVTDYADERTQAHSAQSSLAVTRPSINQDRRSLTSVATELSWSPP